MDAATGVMDGTYPTQIAAAVAHGVTRQAVNQAITRIKAGAARAAAPAKKTRKRKVAP